jgi:hypothetical protein
VNDETAPKSGSVDAAKRQPDSNTEPPTRPDRWPMLDPDALYGLAGEVVGTIAPHTEADPVALLVDFLAAFGSCVGPGPWAYGDGRKHPPRLNVVLIGETAKARKGTSRARIAPLFERVDPEWASEHVMGGLSSGEGLIAAVRDGDDDPADVGDSNKSAAGVQDKRLLVIEEEFARVLVAAGRKDNTLSTIIRQAWDDGNLRVMTRRDPIRATGAYISVLGHITTEEIRRRLEEVEVANGFANRFLFVAVRRSKLLPRGGRVADGEYSRITHITRTRVVGARGVRELTWSPDAGDLWDTLYEVMADDDGGGMAGALTARADAHTLRLSVAYALTDASSTIEVPHLEAAWALWNYASASVRHVFGDTSGDPIRDQLVAAIAERGEMSHAEQHDLFRRHVSRDTLLRVRASLISEGVLGERSIATGGRPSTINYPMRDMRDMRGNSGGS